MITLLYLSYLIGVFIGPVAGQLSNRIGNGGTMVLGSLVFGAGLTLSLMTLPAIAGALALVCLGSSPFMPPPPGPSTARSPPARGRANSFYVLAYYLGARWASPSAATPIAWPAGRG